MNRALGMAANSGKFGMKVLLNQVRETFRKNTHGSRLRPGRKPNFRTTLRGRLFTHTRHSLSSTRFVIFTPSS
jgi:hypothetical protein